MGGHHRRGTPVREVLDQSPGKCGALGRIGAGAHLVEQHQRAAAGALDYTLPYRQVGGKSRETFGYGLFIPDVGEDRIKNGEAGPLPHGRDDAALSQRRDQPHGFEEDTLPTGIGAGDHQNALPGLHAEVERHNGRFGVLQQKRMAALHDRPAFRFGGEIRRICVPIGGGLRAGSESIEVDQCFPAGRQRRMQRPEHPRNLHQDAMDLPDFFLFEAPQLVGELDGHGWLDEKRRTRVRLIVNDATDVPLPLSPDRHHVAPVPNTDGRIGDPDPLRQIRGERLQLSNDSVPRAAKLFSDSPKIGAGAIQDLARSIGRLRDTSLEFRIGVQPVLDERERLHRLDIQSLRQLSPRPQ